MEEKPRSASMHAMYYGLITGAALIVFSLLLFILNQSMNQVLGYINFVLLVGGMVWGTLEYRKNYMNGFISFGKAFSMCFLIGLFAAILGCIYTYIYAEFINPGIVQEILEKAREKMQARSGQMTEEQMDQAMAWTQKFTSPVMMAVWGFLTYLLFSVILGLLAALVLKKEDKSLNTTV